jgi:uncharacterized protein involved in exopolysaccharide biosynthesis
LTGLVTERGPAPLGVRHEERPISLVVFAIVILRWWRVVAVVGVLGGVLGLTLGLTAGRVYKSEATFIPQGAQDASGLAGLGAQFGIRLPAGGGNVWGPPVYVALLRSATLLTPIATDTFPITEENRRAALMDLLKIQGPTQPERAMYTVMRLQQIVKVDEDRRLNAVRISVTTDWPSLSYELVTRLVEAVNQFNLQTRRSQASAERQFAEQQAAGAEQALREAEGRLQVFLQENRGNIAGTPRLQFTHDRLQRDVQLKEQVYSTFLQGREDARLREVRDTPVITVLEAPRLAVVREPRRSVRKAVMYGLAWAALAVVAVFVFEGFAELKRSGRPETRQLLHMLSGPFGRRKARS